jgi:hypothetical protein
LFANSCYGQLDAAPAHRSKSTLAWLAKHNVPLFYHPPNSPDLNPIEALWLELKRTLRGRQHAPTSLEGLKEAVQTSWEEISIDVIDKHISRVPARAAAVFAAKGHHTKF